MENISTIEDAKVLVDKLKGVSTNMEINKGRNKIVKLVGVVTQVYPSMFVIKPQANVNLDRTSYSYSDILCGDIKFFD